MFNRTDEAEEAVALAETYYKAMVNADAQELRRVFHPEAKIVGNFEGALEFASLEEFIATTPDARMEDTRFDYRLEGLTLVGDTAVVSLGGYCYGTWFTDHLSLLKIDGEWRIVNKTFYPHPAQSS